MSNTFHPGVTRYVAEQLLEAMVELKGDRPPEDLQEPIIKNFETILNSHACRAAGIAGNDPSSIYRSVWYKSDGWGHGGSAITWQERAEELEAELAVKNSLIDRAAKELDDVLRDAEALNPSTIRHIEKLLTDIEHL